MIIGTAGHIDHGKTALVKALTGVDADRLAEEKRRGITIDLGFAYADTPGGIFGFVDVPGHERFVHTMLAGATGIDAALLVVALDDGVMPQTREHAAILDLLGIDRGVVALTKADIAGANIPLVTEEVNALLASTRLRDAAILPVSAITGEGIAALTEALRLLGPRQRDTSGHPRLAVDRAFTLAGAGLIVTGTLVAGRIAVDDRLMLSPPGLELRVRGLHAQNKAAASADAGQRVALNITGPRLSKDAVTRGDWVLHPEIHAPTAALDARLRVLAEEPAPLRPDTPAHLHLGAAHVMARVHPLDRDRILPGEDALVRLTLDRPIGALAGDRLVLRDAGASRTIGGGSVIDPFPPARGRRTPARLAQLAALEAPDPAVALRQLLGLPPGWTDRARFVRARNLPAAPAGALQRVARAVHQAAPAEAVQRAAPAEAAQQVAPAEAVQRAAPAVVLADLLIAPATLTAQQQNLLQTLAAWHAGAPDQPGLQPERLRQQLASPPPQAAFRAIVEALLRRGTVRQDGAWLRLSTHQIRLSAADERLWPKIRELIGAERFRPPRARDLAQALSLPEAAMRSTLKRLQRVGFVIELAPDHYFLQETVAEMAGIAAAAARDNPAEQLTAAAFRDRLDNGRKVAIQILEYFDRVGFTVRMGDARSVRIDRLALFGPGDAEAPNMP
jgi:selenocysteine-specific elongation factor